MRSAAELARSDNLLHARSMAPVSTRAMKWGCRGGAMAARTCRAVPRARGRGRMAGPRRAGVVLEPEPREPGRTGLARADLVQLIADASNELRVLVESKPPPKASVVAEHRNRLSSLEASLREHDDLAKEEAKVSELRVLQREQQALQKAVISRSLESAPQDGLRAEDVCKMADAVEEENAALREILEIRRSEIERQRESGKVTAMETENRRLHLKLEALLAREKALLELRSRSEQDRIVVTDEMVAEALDEAEKVVEEVEALAEAQAPAEVVADPEVEEPEAAAEAGPGAEDGVGVAGDLVDMVAGYSPDAGVVADFQEREARAASFRESRLAMIAEHLEGAGTRDLEGGGDGGLREEVDQALAAAVLAEGDLLVAEGKAEPGKDLTVTYRAGEGHLGSEGDFRLVWGFNAWSQKGFFADMVPAAGEEGAFQATLKVPKDAAVLDFVVERGGQYDNNCGLDFHVEVERREGLEAFWSARAKEAEERRRSKEEAKRERIASGRREALEKARAKVEAVLSSEPRAPRAGEMVTLRLDASVSAVSEGVGVEARLSFNRNAHPLDLPAAKMTPKEGKLEVTFLVPSDAWAIDAKFVAEDGTTDDHHGFGYHLPVSGSVAPEPPQHVIHVAVEMAPIAKVGGLADVVTSIGRAVQDMGHTVEVVLPKYDTIDYGEVLGFRECESFEWGGTTNRVFTGIVEDLQVWFLQPGNGFFDINMIYGADWEPIPMMDSERFGFFSKAALEFLLQSGRQPDIIHCHDWSTALVAKSYWDDYHEHGLPNSSVVFTIHNFGYGQDAIGEAAMYSQKFTTVSPSYANEIRHEGCIAQYSEKFTGILNGIDPAIWDPLDDPHLPLAYSSANAVEGKSAAKRALRERVGLRNDDVPVLGIVSRLTQQKGVHLMEHAIWTALERGCQVVVLGSAFDPKMQEHWNELELGLRHRFHDQAKLIFAYDEPLSHLIYAGSDMILVPSMFEPCGLTQLIAMRYGAIPVVRQTGGLRDTVFDVDHDAERSESEGKGGTNGFTFEGADQGGMDYALHRAIDRWYGGGEGQEAWEDLVVRVMAQDWSWNEPAMEYMDLYYAAKER